MKIVIAGGTGFLGKRLVKFFLSDTSEKHEVVVLSRGGGTCSSLARLVPWDARTLGEWAGELNGADVVINMAGKNVKCLYTKETLKTLRDSRVLSTEVIGQAIRQAENPPPLWIQMSAISIYSHRLDPPPHTEAEGQIGESSSVPETWKAISNLVQDWEKAMDSSPTEKTRKIAVRCGVVMGLNKGGAFNIFLNLCRFGLGGPVAGGEQKVSWMHEQDFVQAIDFLIKNKNISGPVNFCSPQPLSQKELMKTLRESVGIKIGLPAPKWLIELSSYLIQVDSELSLKSRFVIPKVLNESEFKFQFPDWRSASKHLVAQSKFVKNKMEQSKKTLGTK